MKKFIICPSEKKYRTIEDQFYTIGLIAAAAAVFLYPMLRRVRLPPCWFHLISGYYCPGCGGTRAVRALLHGRLLQSAWYHPFVPYAAFLYLYFMITQSVQRLSQGKLRVGMRYRNRLVWIAVALIIGNFIVKNLLHYFYGYMLS